GADRHLSQRFARRVVAARAHAAAPVRSACVPALSARPRSDGALRADRPRGSSRHGGLFMLTVLKSGPQTTLQDRGRWGYQRFGIGVAGALDDVAPQAANIRVGNA